MSENLSPEHDAERRAAHLQAYRWRTGVSGNPGGRNRQAEREISTRLRDLTRDAADPDYCPPVRLRGAKYAKVRAQAAIEILDRVYGKPVARVESEHTESRLVSAELVGRLDPESLAVVERALTLLLNAGDAPSSRSTVNTASCDGRMAQLEHRAAANART
jgi:hypothetical protein